MKLLILSDIHGRSERICDLWKAATRCDAVVVAGDITNFGRRSDAENVLADAELLEKPILAVHGNCDPNGVEQVLSERQISVHGRAVRQNGFTFVGAGGSLPCPGRTPGESPDEVFLELLENAVKGFTDEKLVLVTHQPAWGVRLDQTGDGRHTGSRLIRDFIERHRPVLAISGHMHEAFGTDRIGPTVLVNPGAFREGRYAVADLSGQTPAIELLRLD